MSKKTAKTYPVLFLQHGMSSLGIEDQHIIFLARQLSACGYVVVTPEIESIKGLKIERDTVDVIVDLLLAIQQRRDLGPCQQCGFVSASFSAGIGLIALSDQRIKACCKVALLFGAYASFHETLPFVTGKFEQDPYATLVLLHSHIDRVLADAGPVKKVLYSAALDNSLERDPVQTQALRRRLPPMQQDLIKRIFSDGSLRESLMREIIAKTSPEEIEALSPINYVHKLAMPLVLIHGEDDPVISKTESLKLAKRLAAHEKPFVVEVTPLITHRDHGPFLRHPVATVRLARALGYFFSVMDT